MKDIYDYNSEKSNSTTYDTKVIQTDVGAENGQEKCPKCGATEITLNINTGKLVCNFCRYQFEPEKVEELEEDLSDLEGEIIASGAKDIQEDFESVVTLKCTSCGAEVIINTSEVTQARCHWCRNTLSINQQIPNGSIPDVVLPFKISKEIAEKEIQGFVGKRKFFAHPKFKAEFKTDNILGIYLPYMIVDVNGHANFRGRGEHLLKSYYVGTDKNKEKYYDAEVYEVEREFDIIIDGLSIESSSDKLDNKSSDNTNNIINSIMPFDVENCVKWDSNYLKGYNSEKRDINIGDISSRVELQIKDIARFSANKSLVYYDRGVAWSYQNLDIDGQRWKSAYLPVWLYSYQQVSGNKKLLHYVAVNARTKETMGSIPVNYTKLTLVSAIIEFISLIVMFFVDHEYEWLLLSLGIIFFLAMYFRYRNTDARHSHETETKTKVSNLRRSDKYIGTRRRLKNDTMNGANNKVVNG